MLFSLIPQELKPFPDQPTYCCFYSSIQSLRQNIVKIHIQNSSLLLRLRGAVSFLYSSCSHLQGQTVPSTAWAAPCPVVTPSCDTGLARRCLYIESLTYSNKFQSCTSHWFLSFLPPASTIPSAYTTME